MKRTMNLLLVIMALVFTQQLATAAPHAVKTTKSEKTSLKDYVKSAVETAKASTVKIVEAAKVTAKKWKKWWLLGWGLGLAVYLVGVLVAIAAGGIGVAIVYLGWLMMLFGTVSLIMWILNK